MADDAVPPEMPAEWWLAVNSEKQGPLTLQEVGEKATSGALTTTTMVWRKAMPAWLAAGDVPELQAFVRPKRAMGLPDNDQVNQALSVGKRSVRQGLQAILTFLARPVDGIAEAYRTLGAAGSVPVAVFFLVVHVVCVTWAVRVGMGSQGFGFPINIGLPRIAAVALAPVAAVFGILLLCGRLAGSSESWQAALFVGAATTPFLAVTAVLSCLFGPGNSELIAVLLLVCLCYVVYVLYGGACRVFGIRETWAALLVPIMLCLAVWLGKVVALMGLV